MGRKTFESFPKPLPNRTHIVISKNKDYFNEDVKIVHSMKEAIEISKDDPQPFIIGGGEIYKIGMEIADKIELTRVHGQFEADTFFPAISDEQWKLIHEEFHDQDDKHMYSFTYLTYLRK
jgi:dihydrofolate reductase